MNRRNFTGLDKRVGLFILALLFGLIVILGRLAYVQLIQGGKLAEKARGQLKESRALQSPRGTIYDRNGRELAISNVTKSLYVNPRELNKDVDQLAALLAGPLETSVAEVREKLASEAYFIWMKRMLEPAASQQIAALIKEQDIQGLGFVEESKRYYPNDMLAAQILGFVGMDDVGLSGLEMALDGVIKGQLAQTLVDTDNRGIPIFRSAATFLPQKQVKNVTLTIDSTIQFIVEQSLDGVMARHRPQGATIIVMNPRTGEILAMANRPTYNPNQFYRCGAKEWKNRAIGNIYEPGSTFKSITAAAALQEGVVRPDEWFYDAGTIMVGERRIKNWSADGEGYGRVTFTDITKYSINTGFVDVGLRVGGQRLNQYVRAFGFGKPTGIELPGEEEGILFADEGLTKSDTASMSIGQGVAVTPLQLLTALCAIANDGMLLTPHIVKEIRGLDGNIYSKPAETSVRQPITAATARQLCGMLEKVVSEGGGKRAAVPGYRFAGKTGTAEKLREDGGGYLSGRYIASFVGFGPVDNVQLAAIVVIDDPQGVYYGGEIAAPVFGEIMAKIVRYLNIPPQTKLTYPVPGVNGGAKTPVAERVAVPALSGPIPPGKVIVPSVWGKSIREAGEVLGKAGLGLVPEGSGVAVRQSPAANTLADVGAEVSVVFEIR